MEIVSSVDQVRRRPGMFVGDTEHGSGIVHLILEVLANAYDQYLVGRCTAIGIVVGADGTIEITDDGPGFVESGDGARPSIVELLTIRTERPTADGHRPHVHLGLGGLGLFVVNALSERFELVSVCDGVELAAICARGVIASITRTPVARVSGTTVRFRPDPELFPHVRVPRAALTGILEDLTFLSPGLSLRWTVEGDALAAAGLAARVALDAGCAIADVAHHRGTYATPSGPIEIEVAIAPPTLDRVPSEHSTLHSFVNLGRTRGDGQHVDGLLDGVARFLGGGGRARARRGVTAAVSVLLTDVRYGNPTRDRLDSPEARSPVALATRTALDAWAATHADAAEAWRARDA